MRTTTGGNAQLKPDGGMHLFLPSRAARSTIEELANRSGRGWAIQWGVPELDAYLVPFHPGQLISVIARPGHGKTSGMVHLANVAAQTLADHEPNAYVLYATWETLVEEFTLHRVARYTGLPLENIGRGIEEKEMQDVTQHMVREINSRVAVFGRSSSGYHGVPSLNDLEDSLQEMSGRGERVEVLLVDYLQRLPGLPGKERSHSVSENLERLKDIALAHRCVVIVGVQARRDVDDYKGVKLPNVSDGQWSSNIEQTSDVVLGITRPVLYLESGALIEHAGSHYKVDTNLLGMRVCKQRYGRAGRSFMLSLDPVLGKLGSGQPTGLTY